MTILRNEKNKKYREYNSIKKIEFYIYIKFNFLIYSFLYIALDYYLI